mmetsp:Transcript_12890/g.24610  ORF Transcript_12890/g.24610 Transcript_12890/m.24610 type:complete len:112 (-) Transcript_12890:80-415(-)
MCALLHVYESKRLCSLQTNAAPQAAVRSLYFPFFKQNTTFVQLLLVLLLFFLLLFSPPSASTLPDEFAIIPSGGKMTAHSERDDARPAFDDACAEVVHVMMWKCKNINKKG